MRIKNASFLLEDALKDIYDCEKRLVRMLPKMARDARSDELRSGLTEHLEITRNQVQRVERVFELLDIAARPKTCGGMKGIIQEGEDMLDEDLEPRLRDVAIASAARRVEHYEMAVYAAAREIAEHLGNDEAAGLLQQTWDEEQEAEAKLTELSERLLQNATDAAPRGNGTSRARRAGK